MAIDNGNLFGKRKLRRYFLEKYHRDQPPHVLDCCQAMGVLWRDLRKTFTLASYWGVDLKPKKGRLKIDSVRILQQPGWTQNVVDIDTYGSPWKHWCAMLPNLTQPTTVFLTIGQVMMGTDSELLSALGLGRIEVPPSIACRLHSLGAQYLLGRAREHGRAITEALEVISEANTARYIGLRIS